MRGCRGQVPGERDPGRTRHDIKGIMTEPRDLVGRRPTLEDVARAAGVSRATVSRVINKVRNVDPAITVAVARAVAATGYVPNQAARSLVTGRTGTMALVISEVAHRDPDERFTSRFLADPFFGRVVAGLSSAFAAAGVRLTLTFAESDHARDQLMADLRSGRCDGAAVLSLYPLDPLPRLLTEVGVPVVLFGRPPDGVALNYVDLDNREGGRLAAERLLELGRRRIATITGPAQAVAGQDRAAGFTAALAARGITGFLEEPGEFTQSGGAVAMERLLARDPAIDGVFAASDLMAAGAVGFLRDSGRRVPEDVAVVGFDDGSAATATRPPLTTVRQPVEEMAAEIGRLLTAPAPEESVSRRTTSVIFTPTLVVRASA
jgi:DNA-binding LacI/PurR family transcriptional regulator